MQTHRALLRSPGTVQLHAGTDRLVQLVREFMASGGERVSGADDEYEAAGEGEGACVFGAKITGGGSGGTVCVLTTADEAGTAAVEEIARRYSHETGHSPILMSESSMGAMQFGHMIVKID